MTADIVELASGYGRYGYRRVTGLLWQAGWQVNARRVERIWRQEGLKVPSRQPRKRGRLWLNDGSCVRLRAKRRNHVWSDDFVMDRTHEGKAFRMLTIVDEVTKESLAIRVARKPDPNEVIHAPTDLFLMRGIPEHVREIFHTLAEATILIEQWRVRYNTVRPHSAPGYRSPPPAGINPSRGRPARETEPRAEGIFRC